MNVQTNDINDTRKMLTIALDKCEVDYEYQAILGEFIKQASLSGFRPGKAPAQLVEKRFSKRLREELKKRVVDKACREGLQESKVDALAVVDVAECEVQTDKNVMIKITLDVRPDFKVPDYSNLMTEIAATEPANAEIDAVIESLRAERADFKVVERPAQKGDYVRFGYEGTLDRKPLSEIVVEKAIYAKASQIWEEVEGVNKDTLHLPGVNFQLVGTKAGDKKNVMVTFPAEFSPAPAIAGKSVVYSIEVQEVRERVLPALDEAFFKANQVETLDALKDQIKKNLTTQKIYENRTAQRRQVTDALFAQADFAVPESLVSNERDFMLRQLIRKNLRLGVPQEQMESKKKEFVESSTKAAVSRVKIQLILAKIAEAEQIKVDEKDLNNWVIRKAKESDQQPDKLARDLSKDHGHMRAVQQQLLFDKVLDFLVSKASVTMALGQV